MTIWLIALLVVLWTAATAGDTAIQFSSGEQRVTLVELYTSEGCSSCPPADRWLSELRDDPGLWKKFAPVAFHVDYWDYIGWKDRFARPDYSERQRVYASDGQARFVYTPGFFSNGQEWRGWRGKASPPAERSRPGALSLRIDDTTIHARFDALEDLRDELTLHVAVLGMNLATEVRAGENRGKTLRHDFVVLGMDSTPLNDTGDGYFADTTLPATGEDARERAVVAWTTMSGTQLPIQSVGGFLRPR